MAVDYRQLNQQTVKDSYPMPRIQDLTDNLRGTKWFTGIDCVQAFHQIPMADERSKDLTTFRAPSGGLYRFRYMPFGLVNAMAVWSRFIDTVMGQYQFKFVLCYADDCLVYTKSDDVDDHLRDVGAVLDQLHKNGIKVKASKLQIGLKEIPFLGVVLRETGIIPNKEKTKAINDIPGPATIGQLRRTMGMFAYYRKFIKDFSKIAAPLYRHAGKGVQNKKGKNKEILLEDDARKAFQILKKAITESPVMLMFPDWEKPFEIHCDASTQALGAILIQVIEKQERVVMYASRTLNPTEKKYQVYELECLAVVWGVEVFKKYIRNTRTVIRTDCSALQWLKTREHGARVMRWVMRLQEFDLDIQYRKGMNSNNVDGLTRGCKPPLRPYKEDMVELLYDAAQQEVAVVTQLKNYLRSLIPKEDTGDADVEKDVEKGYHLDHKRGVGGGGGAGGGGAGGGGSAGKGGGGTREGQQTVLRL